MSVAADEYARTASSADSTYGLMGPSGDAPKVLYCTECCTKPICKAS